MRKTQIMHVTPGMVRAAGVTDEQAAAATLIQRESWRASQKRFQALAPDEEDRMIAAKWGTYKALKNAAEQRYYDETEKAFEALHAEQAQVIAAALASAASQPRP